MAKYITGDYMLITFDEFGTRLTTSSHGSYNMAKSAGDDDKKAESFAIVRVIYNSKNKENKWAH